MCIGSTNPQDVPVGQNDGVNEAGMAERAKQSLTTRQARIDAAVNAAVRGPQLTFAERKALAAK